MASLKTVTQLAIMLHTLALPNVLFAEESNKNEHKDNGTGNTISHADLTGHVDGDISAAVNEKTSVNSQLRLTDEIHTFRQREEPHRQLRQAQKKAYRQYMQERRAQSAAYNQTQRKAFIKVMEERHTLMKKMLDEHRQAAKQRRESMLLKMHQTSTTPAGGNAERTNKA